MQTPTPGVIIDANVPRSDYERCLKVFDYLVTISEVGPHSDLDPTYQREHSRILYPDMWTDLEDEIIGEINDILPDELVCTVGEFQPGDVIVREVGNDDHDQAGIPIGKF